jgi:hypothetical protein
VKNPVFRAHVAELFEKLGTLGQDPHAVLAKMAPGDRGDLSRGLHLEQGLKDVGSAAAQAVSGSHSLLSKIVDPQTSSPGVLSRGLSRAGDFFAKRPGLAKAAIGTAALAPILGNAFVSSQKQHEAELMNAYADPNRVITASLEEFLEKKAELYSFTKTAVAPKFNAGHSMMDGLSKGLGSALGGTAVGLIAQVLGSGVSSLYNHLSSDPKRNSLVASILKSDPVLSDAIKRHPESKRMVEESYATMVRFAPTLSMDTNAVRSFIREAVLGGSGVNYATIKNLVDTERSISDAKPQYGGKH